MELIGTTTHPPAIRPFAAAWGFIRRWPVIPAAVIVVLIIMGVFGPQLVALLVVLIFGQSLGVVLGLLGLLSWVGFVRIVCAQTLQLKKMDYVALAKTAGASPVRIIRRHVLPGVIKSAIVVATLNVGNLILAEATLSFLGAGQVRPASAAACAVGLQTS